jgi:dihydropteroate synthase
MTFAQRSSFDWQLRARTLALGARTAVMGILNVTPDSFSEAGLHFEVEGAVAHALAMFEQGADLIDIGGESTRPGAKEVSSQEEQDRILPVLTAILRERPGCVLSVDTYHAATALAAVDAGAEIVNDVSGFAWDAAMAAACAELQCGVILMHTRGRPTEWRTLPRLRADAVVPLVKGGLTQVLDRALAAGVDRSRIVLDPGFGFGKVHDENYPLLAHLDEFVLLGQPLLAGVSRKSFLGRTVASRIGAAELPPGERGNATLAATAAALLAGASIVRVHDVRPAVEAAAIADAILAAI